MLKRILGITALILALTGMGSPTRACLNDRDTLAEEAQRVPDVIRIVTGRFEREPAMYYQMRIDRLKGEIARTPNILADYDDIAVAYDRLGQDDQAIDWIEQKRQRLPAYDPSSEDVKEQWYRYYANCGTFHFHHWIRAGANRARTAEAKTGKDMIASALKIKPDAHWGREKYQYRVMKYIVDGSDINGDSATSLAYAVCVDGTGDEAVKGLCGLIMLGNAWESIDIYMALSQLLARSKPQASYLCYLRANELYATGHRSLVTPDLSPRDFGLHGLSRVNQEEDEQIFKHLRAEADHWQAQRAAYMTARMQAGRHPDADPSFWADYHDPGPPVLQDPLGRRIVQALGGPGGVIGLIFTTIILSPILVIIVKIAQAIMRARRAR